MAEALGIVASVIAICQALNGVTKGMQLVAQVHGAPTEFLDLNNELNMVLAHLGRLHNTLTSVADPSAAFPGIDLSHIEGVVGDLQVDVTELQKIATEFETRTNGKTDSKGRPKIPKIKWAWERGKVAELRDRIRRRRSHLSDAIGLLQTDQSCLQGAVLVDIRSICTASLSTITDSTNQFEGLVENLRKQLDQMAAMAAANTKKDEQTTEVLLRHGETLTRTLSSIENSITEKGGGFLSGNDLRSSNMESNVESMQRSLQAIGQRLEELETPGKRRQDAILEGLAQMQNTLESISCAIQRKEQSPDGLEQLLQRLSVTSPQTTILAVGTDHTDSQRLERPETQDLSRNSPDSVISVRTTLRISTRKRCKSSCRCRCHEKTSVRSPGFLSKWIGSFFLTYNANPLWNTRFCNNPKCLREMDDNIQLNYMLPQWMLRRCIGFSLSWGSVTGSGASLHLNIPQVTSQCWTLMGLIRKNDIFRLQHMLSTKAFYPTDIDEDGQSLLMTALIEDSEEIFDLLLSSCPRAMLSWRDQHGVSLSSWAHGQLLFGVLSAKSVAFAQRVLDLTDEDYRSTIIIDAVLGCSDLPMSVEAAINLEPGSINERDEIGHTALTWAVRRSDVESVRTLLDYQADVTVTDPNGWTPLHWAACNSHVEMAQMLIEAGSHIEATEIAGRTPLLLAARNCNCDMLEYLLQSGADVSARDKGRRTAFHLVALGSYPPDAQFMFRIFESLQGAGGEINSSDEDECTPLMLAIQFNWIERVQALFKLGADPELLDDDDRSIFHWAAMFAGLDMIQALRDLELSTLDPDLKNQFGHNASDLFIRRRILPIHDLWWNQTKPTEEEVEAFDLLIEETRERHESQNAQVD